MADYDYQFFKMGKTVSTKLAATVSIRSIFPVAEFRREKNQLRLATQLMGIWRSRLEDLRSEGPPFIRGSRMQYVRNCPPSFVFPEKTGSVMQACNEWTICPWCWARTTAQDAYNRLVPLFVEDDQPDRRLGFGRLSDSIPWRMPIRRAMDMFIPSQSAIIKKSVPRETQGYLQLTVVSPDTDGTWKIESRFLVVLPDSSVSWPRRSLRFNDWEETEVLTTRKSVASQIAKYAAYPVEMMLGNLEKVGEVLKAGKPYPMKRCSGITRQTRTKEVEDVQAADTVAE